MNEEVSKTVVKREHHEQAPLCTTRALYRQGRQLTAVKVYSICAESAHILVYGVPALNLAAELRNLLSQHGRVIRLQRVQCSTETFTETYHAVFCEARTAAIAKKAVDTLNWYGGSLHVCYAPELESIAETRSKVQQRRRQVAARLRSLHRKAAQQGAQETTESMEKPAAQIAQPQEEDKSSVKRRRIKNTVILPPPAQPWFLPLSPPLSTEQSSIPSEENPLLCRSAPNLDSQAHAQTLSNTSSSQTPPLISTSRELPLPPDPKRVVIKSVPKAPVNKICFRINKKL